MTDETACAIAAACAFCLACIVAAVWFARK